MSLIDQNDLELLKNSDQNTQTFTLQGNYYGKVVNVYDGDTCKVNIVLFGKVFKFTVRLLGYDSPEIKTKNLKEKEHAVLSKKHLLQLINSKIVKLDCSGFDKYGRVLAKIIVKDQNQNDIDVNDWMIKEHLGISYDGGTKKDYDTYSKELTEVYLQNHFSNLNTPLTFDFL